MQGTNPITMLCTYVTPCGWCTKWDEKCDKKIGYEKPEQSYDNQVAVNKLCLSESDHEWECCGISMAGSDYICKKCYSRKTVPRSTTPLESSFTGNTEDNYVTV